MISRTRSAVPRRCTASLAGVILAIQGVFVAGCAAPPRHAVPKELAAEATPVGMTAVRDFGDQASSVLQASLMEAARQARAADPRDLLDATGAANVLALSSGGPNGAFGAGFLCGWTETGTRPTFRLVTGISAGALIAPFAFLGPEYDPVLKTVFTTISARRVYREKSLWEILWDAQSLADSNPLAELIASHVDQNVLAGVAAQHRLGRRLLIGTTNLDAGRLVIWDMGAIANSPQPGALELFRKVMLASASIPVAFPPVRFDVEARGRHYDELHVDGGAVTQVFFYGSALDLAATRRDADVPESPPMHLYVIRNGQLAAPWEVTPARLLPIATRTLDGMINAQVVGDLYRIYTVVLRDAIDFNLACMADGCENKSAGPFDQQEMKRLFELGYEAGRGPYRWHKVPPGLPEPAAAGDSKTGAPQVDAAREGSAAQRVAVWMGN
jgi:hypothetical protein